MSMRDCSWQWLRLVLFVIDSSVRFDVYLRTSMTNEMRSNEYNIDCHELLFQFTLPDSSSIVLRIEVDDNVIIREDLTVEYMFVTCFACFVDWSDSTITIERFRLLLLFARSVGLSSNHWHEYLSIWIQHEICQLYYVLGIHKHQIMMHPLAKHCNRDEHHHCS
jgi:hypothetical protein